MAAFKGRMLTGEELVHHRSNRFKHMPTRPQKLISSCNPWLERKQLETYIDGMKDVIAEERVEKLGSLAQAEWDEDMKIARVTRRVGNYFSKFGYEKHLIIFLYPEEALFLLENNNLELLYNGVAMSIQQAYSVLLGTATGCTFIEYSIFSHLVRLGYKVLRHSAKRTVTRYEMQIGLYAHRINSKKKTKQTEGKQRNNLNSAASCDQGNKEGKKQVGSSNRSDTQVSTSNQILGARKSNVHIHGDSPEITESVPQVTQAAFENDIEQVVLDEKDAEQGNSGTQGVLPEIHKNAPSATKTESDNLLENYIEQIVVDENDVEQHNSVTEGVLSEIGESVPKVSKMESDDAVFEKDIEQIVVDENDDEVFSIQKTSPKPNSVNEESRESRSEDSDCQVIYSRKEDKTVIEVHLSDSGSVENENHSGSEVTSGDECKEINCQGIPIGDPCVAEIEEASSMLRHNEADMLEASSYSNTSSETLSLSTTSTSESNMNQEEIGRAMRVLAQGRTNDATKLASSTSTSEGNMSQEEIDGDMKVLAQGRTNDVMKLKTNVGLGFGYSDKEIEVIDLGDTDSNISESRETILESFPNCAGVSELDVEVPPARLLPSNISPVQQSYKLTLWKLKDPNFGGSPKSTENKDDGNYRNCSSNIWANNRRTPREYMNRDNGTTNDTFTFLVDQMPDGQWQSAPESFHTWHEASYEGSSPWAAQQRRPQGQARRPGCGRGWNRSQGRGRVRTRGRGCGKFQGQRGRFDRRPREWHLENRGRSSNTYRSVNNWPVDSPSERNHSQDHSEHENFVLNRGEQPTLSFEDQERAFSDFRQSNKRRNENHNLLLDSRKRPRFGTARYFAPTRSGQVIMSYLKLAESAPGETSAESAPGETSAESAPRETSTEQSLSPEKTHQELHTSQGTVNDSATSSDGNESSDTSESSDTEESSSSEQLSMENSFGGERHSYERSEKITPLAQNFNSDDISSLLQSLQVFKPANFGEPKEGLNETDLAIKYDLYLPSTPFRKSHPSLPDFHVIIMHPDDHIPSSYHINKIQRSFDDCVPLLIAVVSFGTICFYHYSCVQIPVQNGDVNTLREKTGS